MRSGEDGCKYRREGVGLGGAERGMKVHGGIGRTTGLRIERVGGQQRSYRITEGPSEVMKMVIARHVLNKYG